MTALLRFILRIRAGLALVRATALAWKAGPAHRSMVAYFLAFQYARLANRR
jgi:hypothetical protein